MYMHVDNHFELTQQGTALQKMYVLLLLRVGVYSQPHFGFDGQQTSAASPQRLKTPGTFPL